MDDDGDFIDMMCTPHEVIQIGVGAARIVQVTPKCLEYIDNSGQERVIDLQECAGNLTDITDRQGPTVQFFKMVGWR